MADMTLEKAARWMKRLENAGKYGWTPENRKIVAMWKKDFRRAFTQHQSPGGRPWPMTEPKLIMTGTGKRVKKRFQALYRRGVDRMREKIAGKRGSSRHIESAGKFHAEVGGVGVSLSAHNEGDPARGIPERRFVEVTPDHIARIEEIYQQGYYTRIYKGMF